jgi:CDP-diacylglycerol--glycerol-3-phosphate 3-phosphatidyltransferase
MDGANRRVQISSCSYVGKLKTTVQMVAIPFLIYDGMLFGFISTGYWGSVLIWLSAILTIWSMIFYMQKAIPFIRENSK